jgi:hypothetical protein
MIYDVAVGSVFVASVRNEKLKIVPIIAKIPYPSLVKPSDILRNTTHVISNNPPRINNNHAI